MFDLEFDDAFDFIQLEIPSPDLDFLDGWEPGSTFSPWDETGTLVIGDPNTDAEFHHFQGYNNNRCAISAQKMILDQFGFDIPQEQLVYEATANGWFASEVGTPMDDIGKLLESHGVACHTIQHASAQELLMEINQGHKVIVGIDSSEITSPDSPLAEFFDPVKADHAVVVTAMGFDGDGEPIVYLNDPAFPDGAATEVPMSHFLSAWEDSDNVLVATDHAPDDLANHPIYGEFFDAETEMYKDEGYWTAFLTRLGFLGAASAVSFGDGQKPRHSMESLDDERRNKLFDAI